MASSPASGVKNGGRRESSISAASSAETVVSMDEEVPQQVTEEQIFENIRLHKEVLSSVKMQPWPMRRKRRLAHQAKSYVARHEDVLQERLALSRSTRDMMARINIFLAAKWSHWKREAANLGNWLVPWERRIKEIESHFGSVVASYFTFLRWLFWVNIVIATVLTVFVVVPEILTADPQTSGERKTMIPEEEASSGDLVTLWDFEGPLKYSPLFYGYYTNREPGTAHGYRLPLAYLATGLAVYIYSFVATLRKMAENSRMSKLSSKDDECIFSWKLFTGWDYMIGNAETAHNRVASIVLGFKEALLEEAERNREPRNWRVLLIRVAVNLMVVVLLGASAYAVVVVVERSSTVKPNASWWRRNEITVVMSLISIIFPVLFELLGFLERFHPRQQLRLQLARIMVLNLLNLYSLIFAQFDKIENMTISLEQLRPNMPWNQVTETSAISTIIFATEMNYISTNEDKKFTTTTETTTENHHSALPENINNTDCYEVPVVCNTSHHHVAQLKMPFDYVDTVSSSEENSTKNVQNITNNKPKSNISLWYNFYNENIDSFNYTFDYEDYEVTDQNNNNTDFDGYNISTLLPSLYHDYISKFTKPLGETTTEFDNTANNDTDQLKTCFILICNNITSGLNLDLSRASFLRSDDLQIDLTTPETVAQTNSKIVNRRPELNMETRRKLRKLCWETNFGQELVKLTVMDLVLTTFTTLMVDFLRALAVRYMNNFWCWDLEKQFPQYGDFKIAENILHLVNNQGMVWMGMFFSPGLAILNLVKLILLMYLRSWTVMTCNVPHEVVFRASRSNNFYLMLLLTMLFLCVLPVGYAIVWVEPSWHCGPFSNYKRIYHLFTETLHNALPKSLHRSLDYIASPGTIIPLLVLLVLIIYYLISLTASLREANQDLKLQLRRERTEERRKMFRLTRSEDSFDDGKENNGGAGGGGTQADQWRKALALRSQMAGSGVGGLQKTEDERSEFLARIMKQAFQKSFGSSEEASSPHYRKKFDAVQLQKSQESPNKTGSADKDNDSKAKKVPALKKFIMRIPIHKALRMSRTSTEIADAENEKYTKIDESLDEIIINEDKSQEEPEKEKQFSFDSYPIITISKSDNEKDTADKDEKQEEIEKSMKIIDESVELLKSLNNSEENILDPSNSSDGKSLMAPAEKSSVRLGRKLLKECRRWQKQTSADQPEEVVEKYTKKCEDSETIAPNPNENESKCSTESTEGYQDSSFE
ncbi:transmembrane channel-like protein 2 [Ctenocephalides felis]|uniref:transmembrane channel-like protein 2 n=1 Tax=Ctenocephalides felis TaxID=7515 RepID=UPI000E6E283E|nr:transmembrane channel-like protein 2 [Ctenocephalides felis]